MAPTQLSEWMTCWVVFIFDALGLEFCVILNLENCLNEETMNDRILVMPKEQDGNKYLYQHTDASICPHGNKRL